MSEIVLRAVGPLVSFSVQTLSKLLIEEARFLGAVGEEVEVMKTELNRMQSFLIDADERGRGKGSDASVLLNMVVEIRELAYDAEEVIATFVVKVAGEAQTSSTVRFFRFVKTIRRRRKVGKQIEAMNIRIENLTRRFQTYNVQAIAAPPRNPRITSHVVEENVVGLQDHVNTVVAYLKDKTHARVITIWGMGGLGKTTFSKEILRQREVTHYFDHVAWVCVSQQCDPVQCWRDILLKFYRRSEKEKKLIRKLTKAELIDRLYHLQEEKKCLVILDDIWKREDWDSLYDAFPDKAGPGSKIIVTTRIRTVVSHARIPSDQYEMPYLNEAQCVELLKKKVYPDEQETIDPEMNRKLDEIARDCGDLPLAIILVGGLLAKDKTLAAWERVCRDLRNCFNKGNGREWGVNQVLALSYQDLPCHLKACFLYLSLFPEDHEFEVKSLVQMWIAEGFVPAGREGTETSLQVGLSYLDELVNSSMVQAKRTRFSKRVRSFRLHDLMREFCLSKAKDENFSRDLPLQNSPVNKIRRLAIYLKDDLEQVTAIPDGQHQHVRSCLVHGDELKYWDVVNSLLKGFKFLKVLNLVGSLRHAEAGKLSKHIGKLIQLRYLRFPQVAGLPSSLGNLMLLQTLDLRDIGCNVPNVLSKLKELIHLYLPLVITLSDSSTKLCLDGLIKLESLINFDSCRCDVGSLRTLTSIRKLVIWCNVNELAQIFEHPTMFRESNRLLQHYDFTIYGDGNQKERSLLRKVIACPCVIKFSLSGRLYEEISIEKWNSNITHIVLNRCRLMEDPMPALGKMNNLRSLELNIDSYTGEKMVCLAPTSNKAGGFPQLTRLSLIGLRSLAEWEVEKGAMTCLKFLEITNCKNLKEIPVGLKFITTLETVNFTNVNQLLKLRIKEGGDDFHKIQHVLFVTLS